MVELHKSNLGLVPIPKFIQYIAYFTDTTFRKISVPFIKSIDLLAEQHKNELRFGPKTIS